MTLAKPQPVGVIKAAYTVREASYALGINERAVRELVQSGALPIVPHLGAATIRIPARALEAFANGEQVAS